MFYFITRKMQQSLIKHQVWRWTSNVLQMKELQPLHDLKVLCLLKKTASRRILCWSMYWKCIHLHRNNLILSPFSLCLCPLHPSCLCLLSNMEGKCQVLSLCLAPEFLEVLRECWPKSLEFCMALIFIDYS